MSREPRPVFLERDLYRRRRAIDAAKLLPVLGVMLFVLPVLLLDVSDANGNNTSNRLLYFFGAWVSLIAIAFVLSRWARGDTNGVPRPDDTPSSDDA